VQTANILRNFSFETINLAPLLAEPRVLAFVLRGLAAPAAVPFALAPGTCFFLSFFSFFLSSPVDEQMRPSTGAP
jgi:hypothetical protein